MADQSGSTRFQALFESASQAYESVTLAQHPLAFVLQGCDTVDNINPLLQGRTEAFCDWDKAIKTTVSILTPLSDPASLVDVSAWYVRKR